MTTEQTTRSKRNRFYVGQPVRCQGAAGIHGPWFSSSSFPINLLIGSGTFDGATAKVTIASLEEGPYVDLPEQVQLTAPGSSRPKEFPVGQVWFRFEWAGGSGNTDFQIDVQ